MTDADLDALMSKISVTDPDNTVALLGSIIGRDKLKVVLDTIGGGEIYLPRFENFVRGITRNLRDRDICLRYNGSNTRQLAVEYELQPRRIQQIVATRQICREVD